MIYIAICISLIYPYYIYQLAWNKHVDVKWAVTLWSCLFLGVFMALRGRYVGVDTHYYCVVFSQFGKIRWRDVFSAVLYGNPDVSKTFTFDLEPGFRLLNKLLSEFSNSPQTITIAITVMIMVLLYVFVMTQSPIPLLSMWLYVTLGLYQSQMNVSRNAIAVIICYLAFDAIKKSDPIRYVCMILLASTIHQSVIIFIPLYWLIKYVRFTVLRMGIGFVASIILGQIVRFVGKRISHLIPFGYGKYLQGGDYSAASVLIGVFAFVLFLVVWFQMTDHEKRIAFRKNQIGGWMLMLNVCAFGLNTGIEAGSRVAALFGLYEIVFIPQLISHIEDRKRKEFVIAMVVLLCFFQYISRMAVNNIGGTMPYYFFWND